MKTGMFICLMVLTKLALGQNNYRVPAEWEKQQAFLVSYNGYMGDSALTLDAFDVIENLIGELAEKCTVFVLTDTGADSDLLIGKLERKGVNVANVRLFGFDELHSMGVCRDVGPIIAKNRNNENILVQFNWSPVGFDASNKASNQPAYMAERRDRYFQQFQETLTTRLVKLPIAIEGGEIENNGNDVLILVESFTKGRNANFEPAIFDSLLQSVYGKSKIIWLKQGDILDPGIEETKLTGDIYGWGMGGHIDEFARFVNDSTIFLAFPSLKEIKSDSIKLNMYKRMKTNYDILKNATDLSGRHFRIVKVPVPDILPYVYSYDTAVKKHPLPIEFIVDFNPGITSGATIKYFPAVSYLNFVFANDKIIIPKYYRKGYSRSSFVKDRQVLRIFKKQFRGKRIVQMDVLGLNYGAGGIHCWTQQIPE